MRLRAAVFSSLVLAGGCADRSATRAAVSVPSVAPDAPAAELALRVSDTVAVWFTSARADTSTDGAACLERVMEIRAGSRVVLIPLLYTGEIPTITNDSTLHVHIWRHCVPADLYRVNLHTGQPTRIGA